MLDDDAAGKRRLLMAMVGAMAPDLWPAAARASLDRALTAGDHKDPSEVQRLAAEASVAPARAAFEAALADRQRATDLIAQGQSIAAMDLAEQAHQQVIKGWCLLEQPARGERRAFWCHSAFGVEGMDWDAAIKNLADNGFTAIHAEHALGRHGVLQQLRPSREPARQGQGRPDRAVPGGLPKVRASMPRLEGQLANARSRESSPPG